MRVLSAIGFVHAWSPTWTQTPRARHGVLGAGRAMELAHLKWGATSRACARPQDRTVEQHGGDSEAITASDTLGRLKGVVEITPRFETVFVLACQYATSKLCQGMCHHYGARHVSPRLHIHRFRPWAPVRLPGVCFLTNACGSPIAHFKRSCSPAGWICGKRASGHRGGT